MIKKIIINKGLGFTQHCIFPLVINKEDNYLITLKSNNQVRGAIFQVTAIRADGVAILDYGVIDGFEGNYIIKDNMYSTVGKTIFRLSFISSEGKTLLANELICSVVNEEEDYKKVEIEAIKYFKSEKSKHSKPFGVFYDMAVLGIEKRYISKKVIPYNGSGCHRGCPTCGILVGVASKFCDNCGQLLSWSVRI